MIEANDLRINNWVLVERKPVRVIEIDSTRKFKDHVGTIRYEEIVNDFPNDRGSWLTIIQPIPLTSEILEKAGFEKINGYMVNKHKKDCHIVLINAVETFKVSVTGPFGMVSTKSIFYLHQLQNLYHSLTGAELEINLQPL